MAIPNPSLADRPDVISSPANPAVPNPTASVAALSSKVDQLTDLVTTLVQNKASEPVTTTNPITGNTTPVITTNPITGETTPVTSTSSLTPPMTTTATLDKDAQIEALTAQLAAARGATVVANSPAKGLSDPEITLSQIEPGIKWAIREGMVTVDDFVTKYGAHMKDLLGQLL